MKKQIQLPANVAEIELVYRTKVKQSDRPRAISYAEAYKLFLETWDADQVEFVESFKIMLLDIRLRAIGILNISSGTTSLAILEPKLIFAAAIRANAHSILLAHNHPSGDIQPSLADRKITEKLVQCGLLLEFPIRDHLIITPERYFSFADEGLL